MMNESYENLDGGEPRGRLQILLHRMRWRWILVGIMSLAFAIPFMIAHLSAPGSDIGPDMDNGAIPGMLLSPSPAQSLQAGNGGGSGGQSPAVGGGNGKSSLSLSTSNEYKAAGESSTSLNNFTDFSSLSCTGEGGNGTQLTSISLSNYYLEAEKFSKSIEKCSDLESITLENIWLVGNFTRVTLTKLTKFVYVQNGGDTRDSYKSPETLQTTLFFNKVPPTQPGSPSWSVEKDLLNLGVDITISKAGTKLLDIRRTAGEIYLNVKYCEDTLLNVKGTFSSLTLINCNVTTASLPVIPETLKYLNVRNSVQRTPQLADLIRKLTSLEELYLWLTFHCDWPGYELFLNINDLPLTLTKLGINNVDTTYEPSAPASSVKQLTIGDYTTNKTISEGLPKLFPNLERLNVINMSDPSPSAGYSLVHTAIKMQVKEIAVVNMHRNYSTMIANQEDILEVENVLDHAGIPKAPLSCFLLQLSEKNSTTTTQEGGYSGRLLSEQERHQIRYQGLGFDKMDSFEDYVKWDSLQ